MNKNKIMKFICVVALGLGLISCTGEKKTVVKDLITQTEITKPIALKEKNVINGLAVAVAYVNFGVSSFSNEPVLNTSYLVANYTKEPVIFDQELYSTVLFNYPNGKDEEGKTKYFPLKLSELPLRENQWQINK